MFESGEEAGPEKDTKTLIPFVLHLLNKPREYETWPVLRHRFQLPTLTRNVVHGFPTLLSKIGAMQIYPNVSSHKRFVIENENEFSSLPPAKYTAVVWRPYDIHRKIII